MASTRASSPEVKATCVGRAGRGIVACGWKGFVLALSSVAAEIAFLTASEEAIANESGPAPIMMPFVGATARSEDDGAGRASSGQAVGSNRTLLSLETPLNPTSCIHI